jgi:hypothetical protein
MSRRGVRTARDHDSAATALTGLRRLLTRLRKAVRAGATPSEVDVTQVRRLGRTLRRAGLRPRLVDRVGPLEVGDQTVSAHVVRRLVVGDQVLGRWSFDQDGEWHQMSTGLWLSRHGDEPWPDEVLDALGLSPLRVEGFPTSYWDLPLGDDDC